MSLAMASHPLPWTEEEFFALGETDERIELLDGSLILSPSPTRSHQQLSRRIANALELGTTDALWVAEAVNVRLRPRRILIPDIVVGVGDGDIVIESRDVRLVGEVVSPGNAATDRVLKMQLYAAAGIPWYLLVDRDGIDVTLSLFRLEGAQYVTESVAKGGEILHLVEPVRADLDPARLLDR